MQRYQDAPPNLVLVTIDDVVEKKRLLLLRQVQQGLVGCDEPLGRLAAQRRSLRGLGGDGGGKR